ncbi:MAG: hypothetical protein HKN25_15380 [Pyrinomonadaceae bacterium]|nr:hypothetical protein [Pyrinomonadaceae bacterium]
MVLRILTVSVVFALATCSFGQVYETFERPTARIEEMLGSLKDEDDDEE